MKIYNAIMSSILLLFVTAAVTFGQVIKPVNDPDFNAKIARPAYTKNYPKVLLTKHTSMRTSPSNATRRLQT
jgi:hypothetical protein